MNLTKGKPLYELYFETEDQSMSSIGLSNLKDPPHNSKSKSNSKRRLNLQFFVLMKQEMKSKTSSVFIV